MTSAVETADTARANAPAPLPPRILAAWWPLAGSWILMGLELPAFVAAASRLPNSTVNLAAFSSVVYPVSMVVEGPIVMLLAASTALVVDHTSYRKLRRFTIRAALLLTAVHAAIAFTPFYDVIARTWIRMDEAAIEPGRLGLQIMLPWSASIAYRRFQQGVLIRYGHSRGVAVGTLVRLLANASVLAVGLFVGTIDGIIVGASAIATGVIAEAVYAAARTRRVLRHDVPQSAPDEEPLTRARFVRFYLPLALTPLITLGMQPITAAAIWRMPRADETSACWAAVYGLIFLFRAFGFAFQEVVVSFANRPAGRQALRTFALRLGAVVTVSFALVAFTPIGGIVFADVLGLPSELLQLAEGAIGFGLLLPGLAVWQHYLQGLLVAARRNRGITEAVKIYLVVATIGFFSVAVPHWRGPGLPAALIVLTIAGSAQLGWLRWRHARVEAARSTG